MTQEERESEYGAGLLSQQAQLSSLLHLVRGVIWEADLEQGVNTFVSDQITQILGYTPEEWCQPGFWEDHIEAQDRQRVLDATEVGLRSGSAYELEYRMKSAGGRVVWLRDMVTPVKIGDVQRVAGLMVDITRQKEAEERLNDSRLRLSQIIEASPVGMVLTREADWQVLETNEATLQIINCPRDVFMGDEEDYIPWVHVEDRARMAEELNRLEGAPLRDFPTRLRRRTTGEEREVLLGAQRIRVQGQDCLLVTVQDVTERRRREREAERRRAEAEHELMTRKRRFKALAHHSADLLGVIDERGQLHYASHELAQVLRAMGAEVPEDTQEMNAEGVKLPVGNHEVERLLRHARQLPPGQSLRGQGAYGPEGAARWYDWTVTNQLDHPDLQGLVLSARDVTEQRLANQALEESRRTFEALFERSPDAIMLVAFDGDMPILKCNQAAERMNGYGPGELQGQSTYVTLPQAERPQLIKNDNREFKSRLQREPRLQFEAVHERKDGSHYPVEINLALIELDGRQAILSIERDISERRASEAALRSAQNQLIASEKLASLGRLTAGLAHEINTPLAAVMNNLHHSRELALEYRSSLSAPEVTAEDHAEIASELIGTLELASATASRIGEFIRSVRSHTRDTTSPQCEFEPADQISTTLLMLGHETRASGAAVNFEIEGSGANLKLRGEPGRFNQVVTNLTVNALQACEDQPVRQVTLRLRRRGRWVELQVADTGSGVNPAHQGQLFEPLFTTKAQGTGLGLPLVRDIMQGHFGGTLECTSSVPGHTVFTARFAALDSLEASQTSEPAEN